MQDHVIPFQLAAPADSFKDLEPLKALIGNARIVQLGEQSHGDGNCFEAKIRLVKFLHQEMGFEVLAFESGLYDCWRADQDFQTQARPDPKRSKSSPLQSAQKGVFSIWTGCNQLRPLWDYLAETAEARRRLELAGFDCQFTASASRDQFVDDFKTFARKYGLDLPSLKVDDEFLDHLQDLAMHEPFEGEKDEWLEALKGVMVAVDQAKATRPGDQQEILIWRQMLRSLRAYATYSIPASKERAGAAGAIPALNARDAQMAENLIWLADRGYPNRKIIVWAASFHILRNASEIEVPSKLVDYTDIVPMGHLVDKHLGSDVFTIGFTACKGKAGSWFRPAFELESPPQGTLEDLCLRAGLDNAIIPLKQGSAPSEPIPIWLTEKIFARPLGYTWMKASWSRHFDAMIFQRQMRPATPVR